MMVQEFGRKLYFEYWVTEFNLLQATITIDKFKFGNDVDFIDLVIYKGEEFYLSGKLYICFPKRRKQIYGHFEQIFKVCYIIYFKQKKH